MPVQCLRSRVNISKALVISDLYFCNCGQYSIASILALIP